jgi:eukaryotic-like serine/threonine-protein kinase
MGDVYLAWSGLRLVAIKVLHPHHASDPTFVAMFLAETRVAGRINHSGIAQVLDVGVDGGRIYMVMEYVAGQTLDELIRDSTIPGTSLFPTKIGASVFAFLAHALEMAHRAQVVHRDISPHNVLVTDTGAIKLIDFGIARSSSGDALTSPGTFRGRFGYMAPEYVQGLACDHRVDLFALGVVMWETFTRKRLYPGAAAAQIYALMDRPAVRLDAAIPEFSPALASIVDWCSATPSIVTPAQRRSHSRSSRSCRPWPTAASAILPTGSVTICPSASKQERSKIARKCSIWP